MNEAELKLVCALVHQGQGSKVLKVAQESGVNGGTILRGLGFSSRSILKILGLDTAHREIVLMVAWAAVARDCVKRLDEKFLFSKGHHGVLLSCNLSAVQGIRKQEAKQDRVQGAEQVFGSDHVFIPDHEEVLCETENERVEAMRYQAIITIVDLGKGEDVVDLAKRAGARGATIMHGRGSGIHETATLFHMKIEPEKEVVLVISTQEESASIIESISSGLEIEKPGHGILFTHELTDVVGLRPKDEA